MVTRWLCLLWRSRKQVQKSLLLYFTYKWTLLPKSVHRIQRLHRYLHTKAQDHNWLSLESTSRPTRINIVLNCTSQTTIRKCMKILCYSNEPIIISSCSAVLKVQRMSQRRNRSLNVIQEENGVSENGFSRNKMAEHF